MKPVQRGSAGSSKGFSALTAWPPTTSVAIRRVKKTLPLIPPCGTEPTVFPEDFTNSISVIWVISGKVFLFW